MNPETTQAIERNSVMLPTRKLGRQGLEVSALGLGCMGMSQSYGVPDDVESLATLHRALELGVTFLDTAEVYGPFTNEELLGRALAGRRDRVVVASKFGFGSRTGRSRAPTAGPPTSERSSRHRCTGSAPTGSICCTSIGWTRRCPSRTWWERWPRLIEEGKVRYLGLSEAGEATIRRAHAVHPISALQSEYSLWERNLEGEILPLLRELGIGLVAFSPLGRGFLTGTVKRAEEYPEGDYRRGDPRFQGDNFDANMRAAATVRTIAQRHGATPAQVALAWLLGKGEDVVPIPGTKRRRYLEENVGGAAVGLSADDMDALDRALPPDVVAGPRYNDRMMAFIDR